MKPEITLALHRVAKLTTEDRDKVAPGTYNIDETVRLRGTVKVGNDFKQQDRESIPWADMFILMLAQTNKKPDSIIKECLKSLKEQPLDDDIKSKIKEICQKHVDSLYPPTEKHMKGKVTGGVVLLECDG